MMVDPPSLPLLPRSLSSFWRLWKLTCRYTCRPAWQWRAAMPEKTQKKTSERVSVAPVDWWPRRRVRGPRWSPDETDGEDLICPTEHSDSTPPPSSFISEELKKFWDIHQSGSPPWRSTREGRQSSPPLNDRSHYATWKWTAWMYVSATDRFLPPLLPTKQIIGLVQEHKASQRLM